MYNGRFNFEGSVPSFVHTIFLPRVGRVHGAGKDHPEITEARCERWRTKCTQGNDVGDPYARE